MPVSDRTSAIGGWLFRHRTALPLPIVALLLGVPGATTGASASLAWLGPVLVLTGEALRAWGVHHIGSVSRTRSDRLGPLIDSGPFAYVRNPLYIGNVLLWLGFAFSARLAWLAPLVWVLLALEYHAIVRWEETLLADRMGAPYLDYLTRVPRWWPRLSTRAPHGDAARNWKATVYSERGTLIAIVVGYALLALKRALLG